MYSLYVFNNLLVSKLMTSSVPLKMFSVWLMAAAQEAETISLWGIMTFKWTYGIYLTWLNRNKRLLEPRVCCPSIKSIVA